MTRIGIIGGSGFGEAFAGNMEVIDTKWGSTSLTRCVPQGNSEVLFVARHGSGHKIPPHLINHRANVAALHVQGAECVLATAAVGSLRQEISPGDFVLLDDFLDFSKGDVATFTETGSVKHTDMGAPYDAVLRSALLAAAGDDLGGKLHPQGTYASISGPRYETRAEIRMLAGWGGDVVGMTGAPEAILCAEIGLPYAGVAIVTNYGCGLLSGDTLSHADVEAQMAQRRGILIDWLTRTVQVLGEYK